MTRPQAGPSTPSRGGRFGCPPWALFAQLATLAVLSFSAQAQQTDLDRVTLRAGGKVIDAQVARSPKQQQTGLMHRTAMQADEGMLFAFPADRVRCVWMRDTPLPLSAAFLDAGGRVVGIVDLSAESDEIHCSARPARYVLEMHRGWFAGAGIEQGSQVDGSVFDGE